MTDGKASVDGARLLRRGRALAFPRYPGTEGDARAIEMVSGWLGEGGLEVRREEFSYDIRPAFRALRLMLSGCGVMIAVAGFASRESLLLAATLTLLSFLAGGVFLAWAPWLERLYRAEGPTRTANLMALRPASNPRLSLVFLAHHDSKSQNLTLPYRIGLTLAAILGGLGLLALLAYRGFGGEFQGAVLAPVLGSVSGVSLLVLSTLKSGNRSPGGVDNAGSVAIVCELARLLPERLSGDIELIFLSPGAEEDHMVGAMRWLDAHAPELVGRPVYALNFDGAGIPGRVVLLERFGLGRLFSPLLSRLARRAAADIGIRVRGVFLPPGMGVDAIPFAHRGLDCLTLASGSLGRATLAVHSAGDHGENLDREALEQVARLGLTMAEMVAGEIDSGGDGSNIQPGSGSARR
jgi:hypothetical protein